MRMHMKYVICVILERRVSMRFQSAHLVLNTHSRHFMSHCTSFPFYVTFHTAHHVYGILALVSQATSTEQTREGCGAYITNTLIDYPY